MVSFGRQRSLSMYLIDDEYWQRLQILNTILKINGTGITLYKRKEAMKINSLPLLYFSC